MPATGSIGAGNSRTLTGRRGRTFTRSDACRAGRLCRRQAGGGAGRRRTSASPPQADKPRGLIALTGARIVTMRGGGDEVIENGTVLINGDRISAVGPTAAITYPGRHADHRRHRQDHHPRPDRRPLARLDGQRTASSPSRTGSTPRRLAYGVTTVHDPSNDTFEVFAASRISEGRQDLRPAHLFDRHHPLWRDDPVHGRDQDARRCAVALAPAAVVGRLVGEELQPAAARAAADDHRGRAPARHGSRARRRLAVRDEHDR